MNPNSQQLLTVKEAASYLRCSRGTVWNMRKEGLLQGSKIGRKVLFMLKDLESLVESNKEVAREEVHGK